MDGIIDGIAFGLLIIGQFLAAIFVANNRYYFVGIKKTITPTVVETSTAHREPARMTSAT